MQRSRCSAVIDYHSEGHLRALNDSFQIFLHLFDDTLVHVGSCLKEGEEMSCGLGAPKRKTRKGESKSIDTSPYMEGRMNCNFSYVRSSFIRYGVISLCVTVGR